jgi:hypothetical protein
MPLTGTGTESHAGDALSALISKGANDERLTADLTSTAPELEHHTLRAAAWPVIVVSLCEQGSTLPHT